MSKYKKIKGFTLVELIVSITILSILGVIAYLGYQGLSMNARDGTRISDIKSIQKALSLFAVQRGIYPEPTNLTHITYSGSTVWKQGTFGDSTFGNVGVMSKKPVDPLKYLEYSYSVTPDNQEYQLVGIIESEDLTTYKPSLLNSTYASTETVRAYSIGSYNGLASKINTGGIDYVLAVPSIIANDLTNTDLTKLLANKSLVYNDYGNLPSNFSGAYRSIGSFNFTPNKLILYTGSLNNLNELSEQIILLKNIKEAYSGTIILNDDNQIKKVVETEIDDINPSSRVKILACTIINFSLRHFVQCNDIDYVTFYVINVLHIDITNLPGGAINAVVQSPNGDLRFGTDAGVGYFNGTNWTIYDTQNSGLAHNIILAMSQALNGDMWFGTNLGISVFNGTNWTTINQQNSGLLQNHILEIYTGTDGKIRIGTNNGVSSYDSGIWSDYTKKKTGISHNHVNSIYEDNLGNIWFGTDSGLDKYTDGVITTYKTTNGLPNDIVKYIIQDQNNNMWFGTDNGVSKYNWSTFSTKNISNTSGGLPSNTITYIYQNVINGDLWFGTNNGATKYTEGTNTWSIYNTLASGPQQISGNYIDSINQNQNGNIVIISEGGVDIIP